MARRWASVRPWRARRSRACRSCCPTRSMTPTPRRSLSGAAAPSPVPATLHDGRFTIGRSNLERPGARRHERCCSTRPGTRSARSSTGEELTDIMEFAGTVRWSCSATRSTSPWSTTAAAMSRRPRSRADARERTVLVNSLSKTYAMTGWRVGYCAGPEEIIRAMLLVLQQSSRGPATFVQDAAACALTSDQECVRRMAAEYQARRDRVVERLRGIPGVEPLRARGGPVRDGRRPRAGPAIGRGPAVPVARSGRRRHPRRGLRTGRRGLLARLVRGGRRDPGRAAWSGSARD